MITPAEIRQRASRIYPRFLQSWINNLDFFPHLLRGADLQVRGLSVAEAIAAVGALRESSKERCEWGYAVVWQEKSRGKDARQFGQNRFPQRIVFETPDDLLRTVGKQAEFAQLQKAVDRVRQTLPVIVPWLQKHIRSFVSEAPVVDQLIEVVQYFAAHPRPGCFARELPLSTDTKFIENHEATLRKWLDLALPPTAVHMEQDFARRYGLRSIESHRLVRVLDGALGRRLGMPCDELSLPTEALASLDPGDAQVIVVENKVNLLTLPPCRETIAVHGQGRDAATLRHIYWLQAAPILYWGDIDVDGLEILSQLRSQFPQTESLWMDEAALERWPHLISAGNGRSGEPPPQLTAGERDAYERCSAENLRLEQERIPQAAFRSPGILPGTWRFVIN